jgi:uncharacterized membrane protein
MISIWLPKSFDKPRIPILVAQITDTKITVGNAAKMNSGELLQILKMRLVKGEISKKEYLELRNTIES